MYFGVRRKLVVHCIIHYAGRTGRPEPFRALSIFFLFVPNIEGAEVVSIVHVLPFVVCCPP